MANQEWRDTGIDAEAERMPPPQSALRIDVARKANGALARARRFANLIIIRWASSTSPFTTRAVSRREVRLPTTLSIRPRSFLETNRLHDPCLHNLAANAVVDAALPFDSPRITTSSHWRRDS